MDSSRGQVETDLSSDRVVSVSESPSFVPGPGVTYRNPVPVAEISSLLGELYLNSDEEDQIPQRPTGSTIDRIESEVAGLSQLVQSFKTEMRNLQEDFLTASESATNREVMLRESMDQRFEAMEELIKRSISQLEQVVVECLQRRDEQWKKDMTRLRSSTPLPKASFFPVTSAVEGPCSVNSASLYSKPPIHLEFPTFGETRDAAGVLDFMEKCENFLSLRLLTDNELMATLSAVLTGPARSWWMAEKIKIHNWAGFKKAFLAAFLPTDYMTEVEEQLKALVQEPDQCIRDFAYDYRALSLKWKSDLPEVELVRRILNNCNPALAGSLRGTVHTVEQLVKVGSMVERDLNAKKDYWARVNQLKAQDKGRKKSSRPIVANNQSPSMALVQSATLQLLKIAIAVRGFQLEAVLDTGCTYTLMQKQLWEAMERLGESLTKDVTRSFILADGKVYTPEGRVQLSYEWHGLLVMVDTYIMTNAQLVFPLVLGLDFLSRSGVQLNVGERHYSLKIRGRWSVFPFLTSGVVSHSWVKPKEPKKWSSVCSESLGRTSRIKHHIVTTDEMPVRSRAYRVSPVKKEVIRLEIESMLKAGIIEPSDSSWASPVHFLGLVGWYHKFIPHFAEVAAPLNHLRRKGAYRCERCRTGSRAYPDGEEKVIAYASWSLRGAELNYSTSEKECLAVVWAVEKWYYYLEGNPFVVYTDHAALTWAFNSPKSTSRLTRWTIRLQHFDFQVKYRKGCMNMVPDALSRSTHLLDPVLVATCGTKNPLIWNPMLPVNLAEITLAQGEDDYIKGLMDQCNTSCAPNDRIRWEIQQDLLYRALPYGEGGVKYQLVVPKSLSVPFLKYFHDSPLGAHLGRMKTLLRILEVAWWPDIRKDVWQHVKECPVCQKYKPSNTKPSGYLQGTEIKEPGYMHGMDLMGPFPKSKRGNVYLFVIMDYFTKWIELYPLRDSKGHRLCKILREEIFTRWGVPKLCFVRPGASIPQPVDGRPL
ncbi:hypothetical protein SRHO_G00249460 [Serrasalmus rhombeus]